MQDKIYEIMGKDMELMELAMSMMFLANTAKAGGEFLLANAVFGVLAKHIQSLVVAGAEVKWYTNDPECESETGEWYFDLYAISIAGVGLVVPAPMIGGDFEDIAREQNNVFGRGETRRRPLIKVNPRQMWEQLVVLLGEGAYDQLRRAAMEFPAREIHLMSCDESNPTTRDQLLGLVEVMDRDF